MIRRFIVFLLLLSPSSSVFSRAVPVDIVICMDLSGSTNGLLDRFRDRYWEIIEGADHFSMPVHLRIGFIAYSRPSYGKSNYYVKVVDDLTSDFDQLAKDVFSIKTITEQGDQYVGAAIMAGVEKMSWSKEEGAIKQMFIVGNGTPTLGGNMWINACNEAVEKGIIVNTVFVKTYFNLLIMNQWKAIATQCKGDYDESDINKKIVPPPMPSCHDQLGELNKSLNNTFVAYGPDGAVRKQWQSDLDEEMRSYTVMAFDERVAAKASTQYLDNNSTWDLVDLSNRKKILWEKMDTTFLPQELKTMSFTDRDNYIEQKWSDRRKVLSTIRFLNRGRKREYEEWKKKVLITDSNTLGGLMVSALNKAAASKGLIRKD